MESLILGIHIITAIALILFILLQSGKGGGVSAAFGGGAGAALGQRSAATVLGKLTVALSVIFGITSMSLAILSTDDKTANDAAELPKTTSEKAATDVKKTDTAPAAGATSEGTDKKTEATPKKTTTSSEGNANPAEEAPKANADKAADNAKSPEKKPAEPKE